MHSLRAVARALRLEHRTVRSWADSGALNYVQPMPHMQRLVPNDELRRLERKGFRVDWRALADDDDLAPATSATSADSVTDERKTLR